MEESTLAPRDDNPYAAPAFDPDAPQEGPIKVPASFLGKFGLMWRLWLENLPTIGVLVLTVWLPANLMIDQALSTSPSGDDIGLSWRLNSLVEAVFGPPLAGAVITLLAARMAGERIGALTAMRTGIGLWGRLFAARFMAGMRIFVGMIALIVPGIVLTVRYSLLDCAVVLEQKSASEGRARSAELVKGHGWQIVLLWACTSAITMGWFVVAVELQEEILGSLGGYGVTLAIGCIGDLLGQLITIGLFLYYWEGSRKVERKPPTDDLWLSRIDLSEV